MEEWIAPRGGKKNEFENFKTEFQSSWMYASPKYLRFVVGSRFVEGNLPKRRTTHLYNGPTASPCRCVFPMHHEVSPTFVYLLVDRDNVSCT